MSPRASKCLGSLNTMVLERSERELVEACRRGDREAFRDLFEAHRDRVYSIALRFSGDESIAMDIAQDTFVKLFASIADFRGDAAFQTWIYRLVVNSCFDYQRRTKRLVPLADGLLSTLRASADALADLLRREVRTSVRSAIEGLSPPLRMVVVLRYTEGLSYEEIADALNCSQGTVASRAGRARCTRRWGARARTSAEVPMSDWLERELADALAPVRAPQDLWMRVNRAPSRASARRAPRAIAWAWIAAAAIAATFAVTFAIPSPSLSQLAAAELAKSIPVDFQSSDPKEKSLRLAARACVGLRSLIPPRCDAQFTGARTVERGGARIGEVLYRVAGRDAVLLVGREGPLTAPAGHGQSSWKAHGQVYALAFSEPAQSRLACRLCHID